MQPLSPFTDAAGSLRRHRPSLIMHALRALAASAAVLALAGAAHAADAAPPSPAHSCGPNCQFQAIALPGGVVELAGSFDCGSATCWNGDAVKLHWNVGAASCISVTATPYSPHSASVSFLPVQASEPLRSNGVSFEAGGFQIASGTGVQGFFFHATCRR